jgi:HK97 family phage portal protein
MRSPVRELARAATHIATRRPVDSAPVPYSPRRVPGLPWYTQRSTEGQLRAMGSVGTLFAIVDRLATSTAAPEWKLYREGKPGQDPEERDEVTSHLALDIWNRPNQFFTRALFVETVQQHFELVGEQWWVIARNPRMRSIPLELWPVRPDRMQPIPSPEDYIVGYAYTSPDGEQIPLQLDEVIFLRRPNPYDPYRGIGAVQTILADLEGVRLSAEWNRNFFLNSAEPGGIIAYDKRLEDGEFNEVTARWQEQHKGVANAHRVAVIEAGAKWIDRKITQRDMQFAELRDVSTDVIRGAFGIPKFAVGDIDDVNRATAEASRTWFAEQMTVPRLERLKQALNAQFLPLFGGTGRGVEFDYESPVPGDREADDRERQSKAKSARDLVEAGYYAPEVLEAVGLPEISFGQPDADPDRELLIDLVKGAPTLATLILPMLGFELPGGAAAEPAPAEQLAIEPPKPEDPEQPEEPAALDAGKPVPEPPAQTTASLPAPRRPANESPDHSTGCMLALYPSPDLAAQLAVPDGLPADELHLTVAYCGKADDVDHGALIKAAYDATRREPVGGRISGLARFVGGEDGDVIVALVDSSALEDLRRDVLAQLEAAGIDYPRDHGFTPHITLTYLAPGAESPIERLDPVEVTFGSLSVVHGDQRTDLRFNPGTADTAGLAGWGIRSAADDGPDLAPVQAAHEAALEQLLAAWDTNVLPGQYEQIADQIRAAVDDEQPDRLAALTVDTDAAAAALKGALADMAAQAAQRMADEAAALGENVTAPDLDKELTDRAPLVLNFGAELVAIAAAVAGLLGTDMTASAGREAVRLYTPGASGTEVARKVTDFLKGLTGRLRKVQLGAALHRALNLGRLATLAAAPGLAIVASERMDNNTCGPCKHIDGTEMSLSEALAAYRGGPYWACEGGALCRGTVIGARKADS